MKRFLIGICLLAPLSVSAANKMSMVTYFPVPYVAYSRINVSDQLDAGLTSACNMNLGCNESSVNLQVNTLNVKQYSKLDLNGGKGVWSNSMTLGNGSDNGRIVFNKVRIQGGTSRSINVKDTLNVPSLKLFESDFPDCKQAGGKDGTMSWKPLKLKGAAGSELYLACGEAGKGEPEPEENCSVYSYKVSHKSECCASAPKTDSDCYYETSVYKWEGPVYDNNFMASQFGSDWIKQACEKKCWADNPNTECAQGGELFDGVFPDTNAVVVKGSQDSSNHTCSGTVCDQGWYRSYTCDSYHKDMKFVHVWGYLSGTVYQAYCPPKSSGRSPSWSGSTTIYTCTETKVTYKNGW